MQFLAFRLSLVRFCRCLTSLSIRIPATAPLGSSASGDVGFAPYEVEARSSRVPPVLESRITADRTMPPHGAITVAASVVLMNETGNPFLLLIAAAHDAVNADFLGQLLPVSASSA